MAKWSVGLLFWTVMPEHWVCWFRVRRAWRINIYHGLVACRTSTSACNWCLNVSETVGFPLLVPLEARVPKAVHEFELFTALIFDTVAPNKSYK